MDRVVSKEAQAWLGNAGVSAKALSLTQQQQQQGGRRRLTLSQLEGVFKGSVWTVDMTQEFVKNVEVGTRSGAIAESSAP